MTAITNERGESPGSSGPGTTRDRSGEGRFYAGLVAVIALVIFGTLALVAVLPTVIPGFTSAAITSGSMQPALRPGDVVIATGAEVAKVQPGTIVVFEDPKRHDLVTHRVVSVNEDGTFVTKGDANRIPDPEPIPPENIRGTGRWVVPYVGAPRVWFDDGRWGLLVGMFALTGLAVFLSRYGIDPRYDPWR